MEKEKLKLGDDIIYNVISYSNDKITLERFNDETNKKYTLEIENYKGVGKEIVKVLSRQYIKRLTEATQLH